MNNTNPNIFILKRYLTKDAEDHYNWEIRGFNAMKHPKSMIGFYGSYIHGDSYNILFEFADKGSLEEYFQHEAPPSHEEDIFRFWGHLFELIRALNAIHSNLGFVETSWFKSIL
jgi:serine/threonine protein kinase